MDRASWSRSAHRSVNRAESTARLLASETAPIRLAYRLTRTQWGPPTANTRHLYPSLYQWRIDISWSQLLRASYLSGECNRDDVADNASKPSVKSATIRKRNQPWQQNVGSGKPARQEKEIQATWNESFSQKPYVHTMYLCYCVLVYIRTIYI